MSELTREDGAQPVKFPHVRVAGTLLYVSPIHFIITFCLPDFKITSLKIRSTYIGKSVVGSNIHDIEVWIVYSLWIVFVKLHDVSAYQLEILVTWCYPSREYQLPPIYHQLLLPEQFPPRKTSLLVEKPKRREVSKTRSKVSKQFRLQDLHSIHYNMLAGLFYCIV